jgi:hypothetical protein
MSLGGPLGVAKKISMTVVYSAQIAHLPYAEINTVYKRTETSVNFTQVT